MGGAGGSSDGYLIGLVSLFRFRYDLGSYDLGSYDPQREGHSTSSNTDSTSLVIDGIAVS